MLSYRVLIGSNEGQTVQYGRPYSNPKIHFYFCFCKQNDKDTQPDCQWKSEARERI